MGGPRSLPALTGQTYPDRPARSPDLTCGRPRTCARPRTADLRQRVETFLRELAGSRDLYAALGTAGGPVAGGGRPGRRQPAAEPAVRPCRRVAVHGVRAVAARPAPVPARGPDPRAGARVGPAPRGRPADGPQRRRPGQRRRGCTARRPAAGRRPGTAVGAAGPYRAPRRRTPADQLEALARAVAGAPATGGSGTARLLRSQAAHLRAGGDLHDAPLTAHLRPDRWGRATRTGAAAGWTSLLD